MAISARYRLALVAPDAPLTLALAQRLYAREMLDVCALFPPQRPPRTAADWLRPAWRAAYLGARRLDEKLPPRHFPLIRAATAEAALAAVARPDAALLFDPPLHFWRQIPPQAVPTWAVVPGLPPQALDEPDPIAWRIAGGEMHLLGACALELTCGGAQARVVAREFAPLAGTETLSALYRKMAGARADLALRLAARLAADKAPAGPLLADLPAPPPLTSEQWDGAARRALARNLPRLRAMWLDGTAARLQDAAGLGEW